MHEKNMKYVFLMDIYGSLLTEKQKEVMHFYYEEDLSLGEIAEIQKISRQAVRDKVKRSEEILSSEEDKLGLAKKFADIRENYDEILKLSELIANEKVKTDIKRLAENGIKLL